MSLLTLLPPPLEPAPESPAPGSPVPGSPTSTANDERPVYEPVLQGYRKIEYLLGVGLWLAAFVFFWNWWLRPEHYIDFLPYAVITLTLAWVTLLPAYFLAIFYGGRRVVGPVALPPGTRVAMVVTKAPAEPFPVVARTLEAMLAQDYPHDTWLADEDPTPETIAWCAARNVGLSTRKGRDDYHRETWPRRTRCKEGNLAFFYDHYGYDYDIVAQLDADHVPQPNYLREMLKPFADPGVGYVSAPSICDANAAESWSARGRLYAEASMHGSLQAGYNGGWAPLCIGSHYAVRTSALKEIGGLGPELAEDHSTTLMLNAYGWRGVHAVDAIAHGDGPTTFADLATQEFQWSRSLMTILLRYSPEYVPRLPFRLKFQFIFSQSWYPLFSLFMLLMFAMPIVALASSRHLVDVTYPMFLLHFAPVSLILIAMAFRWRATGSFRPVDAKVLSWESTIFLFARWPWALAGTMTAVRDRLFGSFVDFRVTPKGSSEVDPLPFRVLAPYIALSAASALPALLVEDPGSASGFYIFTMVNAIIYAIVLATIVTKHERENAVKRAGRLRMPATALLVIGLFALPAAAASLRGAEGLEALLHGVERIEVSRLLPSDAAPDSGGTATEGRLAFYTSSRSASQADQP